MQDISTRRLLTFGALACLLTLAAPAKPEASALKDPTGETLDRCLNDPANGSTAGQTGCEATASDDYDRRMNAAYATLMRELPREAAQQLRLSQRAWLAFRDAEAKARNALYETRQGTMYVPMQASDATNLVRDRALLLEGYVRVMAIDE
ncbi:lysozyme inhibitor LprI family protein [Mesorhizobium comanense]|uniref:lysozyme inhibitor LprI family protein n=1 Tax=Mesorhizobium comanense TaxID=2502215 RepID=UPI0010F71B48|nr:lysozyme inhibitor LprI family protein [Mesorhizobium comanense]